MRRRLEIEEATLKGYAKAKLGVTITGLIKQLDLNEKSWLKLKSYYDLWLTKEEIEEIDQYFECNGNVAIKSENKVK